MQLAGGAWWSTESIQPCTGADTACPRSTVGLLHAKEKGEDGGKKSHFALVEIRTFLPSVQAARSHCNFFEVSYFFLSGLLLSLRLTQHLRSVLMALNSAHCKDGGWQKMCCSTGTRGHCLGQGDCWTTFAPALGHNWRGEEHGRESWVDGFFPILCAGEQAWLGNLLRAILLLLQWWSWSCNCLSKECMEFFWFLDLSSLGKQMLKLWFCLLLTVFLI